MTRNRKDRVTEVLIRARQRLTDKRRWQRGDFASAGPNGHRRPCFPGDPRAMRWCALGALQAETSTARRTPTGWRIDFDPALYGDAEGRLQALGDVIRINDRKGHAAVLALYDAAIRQK